MTEPKQPPMGNTYTKEEQLEMVTKMKAISSGFYVAAIQVGNHAFIEFCGLMNEYIQMCENTAKGGGDFTECNIHTGKTLEVKDHNITYLTEKLDCIYGTALDFDIKRKPKEDK